MGKKFIDTTKEATKETVTSQQDGSALTLSGGVRILYDDTLSKHDLYVAINRARDRILELRS